MTNSESAPGGVTAAQGLSNPSLAFGLTGVNDWATAMPFLDIMKTSREFIAKMDDGSGLSAKELSKLEIFDAAGWPTEFPAGLSHVETLWDWGKGDVEGLTAGRQGVYVLEYEGEGVIRLGLHAKVISAEPGRIVFENTTGGGMNLQIRDTDPNGTGDYIRDITIVREDHVELHEAGALFNPDWLSVIEDSRQLRFMDWMETNHSTQSEWADRPEVGDVSYASQAGVPVEVMVQLANETGTDPWFNIPHMATDEYVREFAAYVRENLDPALQATIEYSNEVWNSGFSQRIGVTALQEEVWGVEHTADAYSKRATEVALIFDEVFDGEPDGRIFKVLGTQGGRPWLTDRILQSPTWAEQEPDTYVNPATVFDGVAIATYFGGRLATDPINRAALDEAIADPGVDAFDWLRDQIMFNPDLHSSIPYLVNIWGSHKNIIDKYGDLKLVGYEGGQHTHHLWATNGESEAYSSFFREFVRSEQMGELYAAHWEAWEQFGEGAYNQFGEVQWPNKWGSWGLYSHIGDETPRSALLEELNQTTEAWWENRGGEHFQQGVVRYGDDGADELGGTSQEDYLIGGGGDDVLNGGGGDDGLHGGDGEDSARFSGAAGDYHVAEEGAGLRVTGADGSDYLVSVERLIFDDGSWTVEEFLAAQEDGPVVGDESNEGTGGTGDPNPGGDPEPEIDPIPKAEQGGEDVVAVSSNGGVVVGAVNPYSILGRELKLENSDAAYVIFEKGARADFGAQINVQANYYSMNANRAFESGDLLSATALETANVLGQVTQSSGTIVGTDANDRMFGRGANDRFDGAGGNDLIRTHGGDDVVSGGGGVDRIATGRGADVVRFDLGDGADVITDFSDADTLDLRGLGGSGPYAGADIRETKKGVLLDFGDGDSIFLRGHDADSLADLTILG